jgi:hypothetical protein
MNHQIRELEAQCWEERKYGPPWFNSEKFAKLVAEHEREQCARVCDAADKSTHPADLADAIRARGQNP